MCIIVVATLQSACPGCDLHKYWRSSCIYMQHFVHFRGEKPSDMRRGGAMAAYMPCSGATFAGMLSCIACGRVKSTCMRCARATFAHKP